LNDFIAPFTDGLLSAADTHLAVDMPAVAIEVERGGAEPIVAPLDARCPETGQGMPRLSEIWPVAGTVYVSKSHRRLEPQSVLSQFRT